MSMNIKLNSEAILNQEYRRKWAYFGSTYLGNDLYYLKEFIDLCIQDLGEEETGCELEKYEGGNQKKLNEIGKNWETFLPKFKKIDKYITLVKSYYDKIERKEFTKIKDKSLKDFLKASKILTKFKQDIYALAIFFLRISRIRDHTIKDSEWKVLENSNLKKLEVTPRKPIPLPKDEFKIEK